jgi:hypothetical protein
MEMTEDRFRFYAFIAAALNSPFFCTVIVMMLNLTVVLHYHSSDIESYGCPARP